MFAKPGPGITDMTRAQVNEMCWAVKHLLPEEEVNRKGATQKNLKGKIKPTFWFKYTKVMRGMDKRAKVIPLSRYSPGALQKLWEEVVAPLLNVQRRAKQVETRN